MARYNPHRWGPALRNNGSYHMMMAGATPSEEPTSLLEHSLDSPSQDLTEPVTQVIQRIVRGRIQNVTKTVEGARETGITYTMGFPSALWTPALELARQGGCNRDFFLNYLCPDNEQHRHVIVLPDSTLDPPIESTALVTVTGDAGETISETTTLRTSERWRMYEFRTTELSVLQQGEPLADVPLHAVDFVLPDCVGCSDNIWTELVTGGFNDAAAPNVLVTGDRFANFESTTSPAPIGSYITSIRAYGDILIAGFADNPDVSAATTGGTLVSGDRGQSFVIDDNVNGITEPIHGVARFGGLYIAVGGAASGAAVVYISADGVTWESVVSSALPASDALTAVTVDEDNGQIWMVGESGSLLVATFSGDSLLVSDLSGNLPGSPTTLHDVAVIGQGMITVVGATASGGYYAESYDGGATFLQPSAPIGSALVSVSGNKYRTLVTNGTKIYERSLLTGASFKEIGMEAGGTIDGTITEVRQAPGDVNYFVAVTTNGQTVMGRPPYPNA